MGQKGQLKRMGMIWHKRRGKSGENTLCPARNRQVHELAMSALGAIVQAAYEACFGIVVVVASPLGVNVAAFKIHRQQFLKDSQSVTNL
ncbi:unnamed protein product [Orchesella dallaii]|uniref:Uncharacterized protein n=1 Tax=Orchesella dallaii TaxID=48710 RepID=A0ABP1RJ34_9HEXA